MKQTVPSLLIVFSWCLYYAGHGVSKIIALSEYMSFLTPVYNFFMLTSSYIQDYAGFEDGSRGPWLNTGRLLKRKDNENSNQ